MKCQVADGALPPVSFLGIPRSPLAAKALQKRPLLEKPQRR